ncbi:DUF3298 domain-containing protein [Patescibacteria group bacterium]|nr:MAG: DUF3298 domain-containing protein [Patescibacteria group bacterium]
MKKIIVSLLVLGIAVLGFVLFREFRKNFGRVAGPAGQTGETAGPEAGAYKISDAALKEDSARYVIIAKYPRLLGLSPAADKNFNDAMLALINQNVSDFKKNVAETPDTQVNSSLETNFDIVEENENFVSILLIVDSYVAGAAHPARRLASFNFDLEKGAVFGLKDVFKSGAPYLERLSQFARAELLESNKQEPFTDEATINAGTEPKEENFQVINFSAAGIAIVFNEYQVAAYAAGPQMVEIDYESVKDILNEEGPLALFLAKTEEEAEPSLDSGSSPE